MEVVGVLLGCAVLLVVLARLDGAAYEAEMQRARTAIAAQQVLEQRRAAAGIEPEEQAAVQVQRVPARTESLGDRGPIAIPLGGAWSAGTASSVPDIAPRTTAAPADPELRRIVGPAMVVEPHHLTEAKTSSDTAAGATPEPEATAAPTIVPSSAIATAAPAVAAADRAAPDGLHPFSVLVGVLAALGAMAVACGAFLLVRR